jgi:hypothetical protein
VETHYYLCDVVRSAGDGDEDAFRPVVGLVRPKVSWAVDSIESHPDGRPVRGWCLVRVRAPAAGHAAVRAQPGVDPLPDPPLPDQPRRAMDAITRARLKLLSTRRGLGFFFDTNEDLRGAISAIGRVANPEFDVDRFYRADA